ncbi:MAG: ATP-binding protein [Bacteroidia bacterium]
MLIRFVVDNIFSFGEQKEFNMIPYGRLQTLPYHKYKVLDFDLLKMASIYGANAAGKSNLIKALKLFQELVLSDDIPFELKKSRFRFDKEENEKQVLAIEFIQDNHAFYYAVEFVDNIILTEELYKSGLGAGEDKLIFERKTDKNENTEITFPNEFEHDEKSQILKSILLEEFVSPHKPVFKLLSNRDNKYLQDIKIAYKWFKNSLRIITPESKPQALAHYIEVDPELKRYAEEIMCSFDLGITSLTSESKKIRDYFGEDNEEEYLKLEKRMEESRRKMISFTRPDGFDLVLIKDKGDIWVKQLKILHSGLEKENVIFDLEEESNGTIRLLDFVPMFKDLVSRDRVYFVDEIESSIHPLLIKELVGKFSLDDNTHGQLIFTTHESNLLDQEIFRQDEIWFVEKDKNGSTDLYSLSEYKEHKTIDIRKGYLSGRYGSIPFLGNLKDLNWHEYDTQAETI